MDSRDPSGLNSPDSSGLAMGQNAFVRPAPNPVVMSNSAAPIQGTQLSFGSMPSPVSKPLEPSGQMYNGDGLMDVRASGGFSSTEPVKKKRGRPRKYGPDGSMALALTPSFSVSGYPAVQGSGQGSESSAKRRGRPPGSGKKLQLEALGAAGSSFTPHVITVNPGEDVASMIMSFAQQGSRTVCVISGNGVVCNVALRQPATSGGTVTYEGRFEILSLSGSYLLTENNGTRSRTGGLSVALAGSDGRVLGGSVAGVLTAATPVQVILGSFLAEGKKQKTEPKKVEPPSSVPPLPLPPPVPSEAPVLGAHVLSSPHSDGSPGESSDDDDDELGSPLEHHHDTFSNPMHSSTTLPSYASVSWGHFMTQNNR